MVLCDTDVIIEFFKGNVSTKNILENDILPENIALSIITLMELYFGAKSKIEIYSKSHSLKIPDALIGATSLYYKIPLFTYNKKDFNFIKELKLY